ncbi:hypothetical protein NE237_019866 [Protea cynaroides]|uniref:F-box domain-containing protein n=1 Tax=Protea cynaroides TaxID=273540 RepID=A0A9Q0K1S2_9MAGN|nr:hypothetical protein NE237_019866 [Protea cynaroides]
MQCPVGLLPQAVNRRPPSATSYSRLPADSLLPSPVAPVLHLRYDMDAIMNLPPEIIFEIWSRIPIESVLRCRCVCKLWSILGHDSTFIDLHFSKSIQRTPRVVLSTLPRARRNRIPHSLPPWLLMVNGEEGDRKIPLMGLGFDDDDEKLLRSDRDNIIVGFCNGFLCIANGKQGSPIYLCDLIFRRDSMILPKSQLPAPIKSHNSFICRGVRRSFKFGFGFDSFQNKYKVVRVWEMHGEIITVGESAWRKLDFPRYVYSCPLHLDGILYWYPIRDPYDDFDSILALDLKSEKFWSIKSPPLRSTCYTRNLIGSLDGSLFIIECCSGNDKCMDVWLLEGSKMMGAGFRLKSNNSEIRKTVYQIHCARTMLKMDRTLNRENYAEKGSDSQSGRGIKRKGDLRGEKAREDFSLFAEIQPLAGAPAAGEDFYPSSITTEELDSIRSLVFESIYDFLFGFRSGDSFDPICTFGRRVVELDFSFHQGSIL